ncbi:hypothetical protein C8P68_102481 [Mucilaginibacter yixingensis]|uniref:Uncharacterized protein n=1 Tax=Mucilaginibacter yixingensis TaxID=1295612 RepID=A0A2T5JD25_9SPHI|nr:hypothetical protein [Mucilaginibacter yixingensis]PTQ99653.1 hypothetical protein C8P68_102481 [Mucilaginibacter yixingensis]
MKYLSTLLFILTALHCKAGYKHLLIDDGTDRTMVADTDTLVRKQSVSVGITYGSDVVFFGRTSTQRYPFYTADLIYNSKSGFFAYSSVWKVSGSYPKLDEVDVGGGYVYHLTKRSSGSISYTRFFFNRQAQVIKSAATNDIDFKNSYDWKFIKTSISFDYLFGKTTDIFLTPSISRNIETSFGIFDNKDYLTFNPGVSMIIGTQKFVENYTNADGGLIGMIAPNDHYPNRDLNVLNYSFKLPIAYNRPHYTFEVSPKYSIPVNVDGNIRNRKEFFLNLTFYYLFY